MPKHSSSEAQDAEAAAEARPLLQTIQRSTTPTQQQQADSTAISIQPEITQAGPAATTTTSRSSSSRHLHTSQSCASNASGASSSANQEPLGTCRICFESETADSQDPANPLISPRLCSGSSRFVHRQCLAQWRNTNHRADASWQCEVCHYRYQYRRLWWAGLLGSHVTLTVLYLLMMSALIAVLGFIPVLNLLPSSKASSGDSGSGGSGGSGGGGGSVSPSPSPGGGGGGSGSSVMPQPMWVLVALHIANGLIMMGIVGLFVSMSLGILRAVGCYTGLWVLPEPFCPACFWCLDLSGGPGIGWAPFVECGAAGECGIALVVILVVVMLIVGITAAAYMLYALLWALVQRGLDKAQHMVENVQQEEQAGQQADCTGAGAAAKQSVV